jgi:hypothetical protein
MVGGARLLEFAFFEQWEFMMKRIARWTGTLFLSAAAAMAAEGPGASNSGAEVSGVFGVATAQTNGLPEAQLHAGTQLGAGTIIRVAPRGAVDIYLGSEAGVVRLTQNTMLTLEQLQKTNLNSETYLHLQYGTMLGNGVKLRAGSRYQVKTATGVAAIGNAAFRLHAEGYFVVVDGKAQFAHVPLDGPVKVYTLDAPPAVYFSPTEGVKPAPKGLVHEVMTQSKAKLGR